MPLPVADKCKVQQRKSVMGHGSLHGTSSDGYGKSPIMAKRSEVATGTSGLEGANTLSPVRVGSKRRTSTITQPRSAPGRDRKLGSLLDGVSPSLNLGAKDDACETSLRSKASIPLQAQLTPKTGNISIPSGLKFAPNLDYDSSDDDVESLLDCSRSRTVPRVSTVNQRSLDGLDGSTTCSPHQNGSMDRVLGSIPEKKRKNRNITSSIHGKRDSSVDAIRGSSLKGDMKSTKSKCRSISPGKHQQNAKYTVRPDAVGVTPEKQSQGTTPLSPGKLRAVTENPRRLISLSPKRSSKDMGKSPKKGSTQYHRSVSDVGPQSRQRSMTKQTSKCHSDRNVSPERHSNTNSLHSIRNRRMPQAPLTWHNDRDSRKLNSKNIMEKIGGGLASIPVLDESTTVADAIPRASQRQDKSLRVSSSSHHSRSLDTSRRSTVRGSSYLRSSSQPPSVQSGKRTSQSSHGAQSSGLSRSTHQKNNTPMSQSDHVRKSTISRDTAKATTIPKASMRTSGHKASGMVGSMVNLVDRVLESSIVLPVAKYGLSDREKATMVDDDDSDGESFANEDIEASVRRTKTGKENLKHDGSHALKFMEKTLGIEKKPPKTLVIVWILIVAELSFDFVTTVISFQAFTQGSQCCGYEMNLGKLPVGITVPFFFLVLAETLFLFIAITLTLWPSILNQESNENNEMKLFKPLMCCFKWNATAVLYALNVTVILNPFFGCVIAWMLLYQSNKTESFLVLGLEGGSIILHFASVWLDGSCKNYKHFCFHCVQLVPFLTSVTLILLYLRQGGICYLVGKEKFLFSGCELCPNNMAPINGICQLEDGTNMTITNLRLWEVDGDLADLADALTARTVQGRYCAADHPGGPNVNFCFFQY